MFALTQVLNSPFLYLFIMLGICAATNEVASAFVILGLPGIPLPCKKPKAFIAISLYCFLKSCCLAAVKLSKPPTSITSLAKTVAGVLDLDTLVSVVSSTKSTTPSSSTPFLSCFISAIVNFPVFNLLAKVVKKSTVSKPPFKLKLLDPPVASLIASGKP